ncbi:MAG: hypothetical protein QM733_20590 [Ilumatobacteraceae bacterium]
MLKPQPRRARVFTEIAEVLDRLQRVQLQIDWVLEATRQGHLQRQLSSPLDFPGHGEYSAASRGLRTLAEVGQRSWSRQTFLGIPVVMTHDGTVAVAVTSGDEYTGINGDEDPSTRPLKGPNTVRATVAQRLPLGDLDVDDALGVDFYYMLTYATPDGGVRVEISQPELDHAGHVTRWRDRVIIGDVGLTGPSIDRRAPGPVPPAPEVEVSWKSAG